MKLAKVDFAFIGGRGLFSNYGGVENATREISLEMSKKLSSINVYGVTGDEENVFSLPENLSRINCPLWIYNKLGQHGLILFSVLHALLVSRPKVVFLFASGPCVFTPLLRLGGISVVTSLRAIDSARDKWGLISRSILKFGEYCAWKYSNSFTVNSKEMKDYYFAKRPSVLFIPNGAKLSQSNTNVPPYLQNKSFFLFAARFDPVKRLHLLLEAYVKIDNEKAPYLVIAGGKSKDALYEKKLMSYARDKIIFLGHISQQELDPLMQNCRAFILPSVLEGMSNSLLSAMVHGKAVLAADIAANSDVLFFKDALYQADDLKELTQGLIKLSENDEFCLELGKSLKHRALKNYSWEATANSFYAEGVKYL